MNSAAIAFIVSLFFSIFLGQFVIKKLTALKFQQTISEDVPEKHKKKQGTPTMGGIIILIGFIAGIIALHNIDSRAKAVIILTLSAAVIGFIDDMLIVLRGKSLGLKARQKLALQFLIAIIFMIWVFYNGNHNTTRVYLMKGYILQLGWYYYPIMVLMIVGMSNAFNLADGLDGLAAGTSAILLIALGFLVMTAMNVNPSLTILSWSLAGGCLGFLWYNRNPARIFMGDTGSLALGAAAAGIAIVGKCEFLFLILALPFIIEAFSVIIQVVSFKTTRKRVFKMTPIHHHFELSGVPETKIVAGFWIFQFIIAAMVLMISGVFNIWL